MNLPLNQPLIVRVEPANGAPTPRGVAGAELLRFARSIEPAELEQMRSAIAEGCERVDGDDW